MSNFLLLACKGSIRRISLDTNDHTDVYLSIENVQNALAIDFDYVNSRVYFTDHDLRLIRSADFDGNDAVTLIDKDLITPDGLAVDWIAKNMYWSDAGRNVIEVARVDGSSRKVIVDLELDEPRAIALIPDRGFMFWSDSGVVPKIERG